MSTPPRFLELIVHATFDPFRAGSARQAIGSSRQCQMYVVEHGAQFSTGRTFICSPKYRYQYNASMDFVPPFIIDWGQPLLVTTVFSVIGYWVLGKAFATQPRNRLFRQLAFVVLFSTAFLLLIALLPIDPQTKDFIFQIATYALPAVIALSSTTLVSNAMAGLSLKLMKTFRTGDFIHVDQHFGRVTTKALLHTEIQSEDRDIIALPNLYVISNPVKVVDQSGTLISAELSLGFDVHRQQVRELLLEAAAVTELEEAFVHILDIGDFSVRYKVTGLLKDVGKIVTKRSELRGAILDTLHHAGVEILTPSVMNQRPISAEQSVIPAAESRSRPAPDGGQAERIMFDKAELAARIERFRDQAKQLRDEIARLSQEDQEANALEIAWREHQLESLEELIAEVDQQ